MSRLRACLLATSMLVLAACASTAPSQGPDQSAAPPSASNGPSVTPGAVPSSAPSPVGSATGILELRAAGAPLPAGTFTRTGFLPQVRFTVADGWTVGSSTSGFFDVQQASGTPDVIAVQFARIDGVVGADGATSPSPDAAAALAAIRSNPGLTVVDASASTLGGMDGRIVVVENRGTTHAGIMKVVPGLLGIDAGRKLWIGLFDTSDGLLGVLVGGSIAKWQAALNAAEPVLDSVVVGAEPTASPSN